MHDRQLAARARAVRARTLALTEGLSPEDQQIQAVAEASPSKWHLGHTTWFFETFVLAPHVPGYRPFDDRFSLLFNSYYEGAGPRFLRDQRGLLSRPSLERVGQWRAAVDAQLDALLNTELPTELRSLIQLGLHHEEQHQELLLTDIQRNLSVNPIAPRVHDPHPPSLDPGGAATDFVDFDGGLCTVGHAGPGFHFDNEGPAHQVFMAPFSLARGLVSNGQVAGFIAAGGYQDPRLWLSDGIAWARSHRVEAPHTWAPDGGGGWTRYSLSGRHSIDPHAPVVHLNAYEADAIATWLGARLPTEQEWEVAARQPGPGVAGGRWQGSGSLAPQSGAMAHAGLEGLFGEAWEWTRSAYAPYPGYRVPDGAVGEYNGKFMSSQWVLRGGSCATPPGHVRATYRNFFYLHQRWQFSGLRLARDGA